MSIGQVCLVKYSERWTEKPSQEDLFFFEITSSWTKTIDLSGNFQVIFGQNFDAPRIILSSYAHGHPDSLQHITIRHLGTYKSTWKDLKKVFTLSWAISNFAEQFYPVFFCFFFCELSLCYGRGDTHVWAIVRKRVWALWILNMHLKVWFLIASVLKNSRTLKHFHASRTKSTYVSMMQLLIRF